MKHPQVDTASQFAKDAWAEFLRNMARVKVQLTKLTDQAFVVDQLQLIFKDESEFNSFL